MHTRHTLLSAAALSAMVMTASADIDVDMGNVPAQCRDTCRPLARLADKCDVDLDDDRNQHRREVECICSNTSFDVGGTAASCRRCITGQIQSRENGPVRRDHDGDDDDHDSDDDDDDLDDWNDALKDVRKITRVCDFSNVSSSTAPTTSVSVTPTSTAQSSGAISTAPVPTSTGGVPDGGSGSGNDMGNDTDSDDDDNDDDSSSSTDPGNAAGAMAPSWLAGALVVGGGVAMLV